MTDDRAMIAARLLVEDHIQEYGMVPHPDKMKEAIAKVLRDSVKPLQFYADPKRYEGDNQRLVGEPDTYQPKDCPYLWSVNRDGGNIARSALFHS